MELKLKYRPKELKEIIGNAATVQALEAVLSKKDLPHVMLFTGPSGCGKTTLARIVAARLGCSESDLVEVDSADFRGIDFVRELRQQMRLRPLSGGVRVWILDEVHQMTKDAQSALLKALEDTPGHVFFLLATTDPQKLLKTIVNRCMQFVVQPLTDSRIVYLVKQTAQKEGKRVPDAIVEQIAHNSSGSPRAAMVMLDKVLDLPADRMSAAVEQTAKEENDAIELCRALMKERDWLRVAAILKGLDDVDPEQLRQLVLSYCTSTLLNSDNPKAYLILDSFKDPFYSGKSALVRACYQVIKI